MTSLRLLGVTGAALVALPAFIVVSSCSAGSGDPALGSGGSGGTADGGAGSGGAPGDASTEGGSGGAAGDACPPACSADYRAVVGCNDEVTQLCELNQMCADAVCQPACEAANKIRSSVGCEYFPVAMEGYADSDNGCFAAVIANTWPTAAHVSVAFKNVPLDTSLFGYLPKGGGTSITYEPYNPAEGIPKGQVAIFFLAGPGVNPGGAVECPQNAAITNGNAQVDGTGKGYAFQLTSDVPVVAYQILPYGGGAAAVTGASLLLPTSVWDDNYVAVNAYKKSNFSTRPSLNIIAKEDGTEVTLVPRVSVAAAGGLPSADANTAMKFTLNRGEHAQITQLEELTGSPIGATKPVALMAGHECMHLPVGMNYCDHAEQQIPPVRAMGSDYIVVTARQRSSVPESPVHRIVGAVDGTQLTFDPPGVHPAETIGFGTVIEFTTSTPFVVRSQDADHPYLVTTYMTGEQTVQEGYGDPDFVRIVPPQQYLQRYVFFTDPTYPETNLVVIREKGPQGFADVTLDCMSEPLVGWQPVGSGGQFEFTRVDLVRHNFEPQGECDNGLREMKSDRPFGLWVWGWGTPETTWNTRNVSYGYPAGESVLQLNDVFIPSVPK